MRKISKKHIALLAISIITLTTFLGCGNSNSDIKTDTEVGETVAVQDDNTVISSTQTTSDNKKYTREYNVPLSNIYFSIPFIDNSKLIEYSKTELLVVKSYEYYAVGVTDKKIGETVTYVAERPVATPSNIKNQTFWNVNSKVIISDTSGLVENEITVNGVKMIHYEGICKTPDGNPRYVEGYSCEYEGYVLDIQGIALDKEQKPEIKAEMKDTLDKTIKSMRNHK